MKLPDPRKVEAYECPECGGLYLDRATAEHAADWRRATDGLSSPSRIYSHPDYLRIIAMGPRAIPWILADLRINGGEWYAALEALTGQNPVSPEDEGFVGRMDQAWLRWGQSHGYAV